MTVSLLLAIGSAAETPFRCMDEFDVSACLPVRPACCHVSRVAAPCALRQCQHVPTLGGAQVFMDTVTRRVATGTLLEYAFHTQSHAQYVFLTPQDVETVRAARGDTEANLCKKGALPQGGHLPDDFLLVRRMHAPRDNARTQVQR